MQFIDQRLKILLATVVVLVGAVWLLGPLQQNLTYHAFADQRPIGPIANGLNVLSNLFFLVVGVRGIANVIKHMVDERDRTLRQQYLIFFMGVILVGFGSGYYHFTPANITLVWDRLAMVVAIMAFGGAAVSELISRAWGKRIFIPLLILGVASVLYWFWSERQGHGDLRPYVLAQFMPFILILLMAFLYKAPKVFVVNFSWLLIFYGIAKVFEMYDAAFFRMTGNMLSGHSMKHMAAAGGIFFVVRYVRQRYSGDAY